MPLFYKQALVYVGLSLRYYMSTELTLLIVYALFALGVSFLCSITEAVLLSVTPSYVAALDKEDKTGVGQLLRDLKNDVDRPLAAILSLNTIAHTVGAAGVGAQAQIVFESTSVALTSAVLTFLILVISEVIPKTLGAIYWRRLAPNTGRMLRFLIWGMYPLVLMSQVITDFIARGAEEEANISRREITALADLGVEAGIFEEEESRILKNLFRFGSLRVEDIMTPRTVVFAMPAQMTIGGAIEEHEDFRFSRIPVYRENRDDITGYVLKNDILIHAAREELDTPLSTFERDILMVPEALPLPKLFERLLDRLEHIALVMDEYGGVAGVVTMEDVVETLLGLEIVDEADSVQDMQALARQQWYKRARRLGLVSEEDLEEIPGDELESVIRLGITGEKPPQSDSSSSSDNS